MTRPIFHPLAERELLETIDWYEGKMRGLGGQFLGRVTEALEYVQALSRAAGPSPRWTACSTPRYQLSSEPSPRAEPI